MKSLFLSVCATATLMCSAALAVDSPPSSTTAYQHGMGVMHHDMDIVYTGQIDTDFVRGMIPHHQGAIDMAEVELQYGKDETIKDLAHFIKVSQEGEIAFMHRWLERRGLPEPKCRECEPKGVASIEAFKQSMMVMHHNMNIAYSGDADVDFVCGMIPHHQGAIDMAEILRADGSDPEILKLATGIIRSQNSDIARMNGWLKSHNVTCKLSDVPMQHAMHGGMHH